MLYIKQINCIENNETGSSNPEEDNDECNDTVNLCTNISKPNK